MNAEQLQRAWKDASRAAQANTERVALLEAELSYARPMADAGREVALTWGAARLHGVEGEIRHRWSGLAASLDVVRAAHEATTPAPGPARHVVIDVEELQRLREIADEAAVWSISTGPDTGFGLRVALDKWRP